MLELQALDRVHRLGQTKPVKAFRYVIDSETSIEQVCAVFPCANVLRANIRQHMIRVQERKLQLMSSSFQDYASDDQGLRESITVSFAFLYTLGTQGSPATIVSHDER